MSSYALNIKFIQEGSLSSQSEEFFLVDTVKTWEEWKIKLDFLIMDEYQVDRIKITIGYDVHKTICRKQDQKFILSVQERLFSLLEHLEEHIVYQQLQSVILLIHNPFFLIFQPFLRWVSKITWLKKLDIESTYQLTFDDFQLLQSTITSKLVNLERFDCDIFGNEINNQCQFQTQKQLTEMSFRFNNNFRHLDILECFINLRSLVFVFSLMSTNQEIDPSLARISQLSPQLKGLALKLTHSQSCILASAQRLKNLQTLKIELTGSMKQSMLDLSQLKQLSKFYLKCIDPLSFFCSQKNIDSLLNLTLINLGGYLKGQDSRDNDLDNYFKSIKSHKNLQEISLKSKGSDVNSLKCFKRDMQVVSHILKQLNIMKIDCLDMKIIKEQGIDEDLAHLFIQILDSCKNETNLNLFIPDQFASLESKIDLALAVRRLKYPQLFSLCGAPLLENMKESINSKNYLTNQKDVHQILISLGIIGSSQFLSSKIINLPVLPFLTITDKKEKRGNSFYSKLQELLHPFCKINLNQRTTYKFPFQLIDIVSKNLTFLRSEFPHSLQDIDYLSTSFPNLITFQGIQNEREMKNSSLHKPMRNLNYILELNSGKFIRLKDIFSIQGHFVTGMITNETIETWNEVADIFQLVLQKENRIVIQIDPNFELKSEQEQFIDSYNLAIHREVMIMSVFFNEIGRLLSLNPRMVYYDITIN